MQILICETNKSNVLQKEMKDLTYESLISSLDLLKNYFL